MASNLVPMGGESRVPASFEPKQTFVRCKALEAAAKYAARIGNFALLEKAITEKLEEEAAFAAHVQALFRKGGQSGNKNAAKNEGAPEGVFVSLDCCSEQANRDK